ncbi:MAG: sporulation protein YqfD [Clostridia bacterium]|nr:sporulation protein YqfD [Clostridia bacterium]
MKFSKIGKNIKAVVTVEVEGFFVERLINLLKNNGVDVWDVKVLGIGDISFNIESKDFKKILPYVKKSKCKAKVISKRGIYFEVFKYRKRRIALYMLILVTVVYIVTSSFIWHIEIEGNEKVNIQSINKLLREYKMVPGTLKKKISKGNLSDYLRANIYEAAWVGVDIVGTTMKITIKEKIISKEEDRSIKGDIIATKDAVITRIVASTGTALYKEGSFVKSGDILIAGVDKNGLTGETRVHASGVTRGIVEYKFSKEYKEKNIIKEKTGKSMFGVGVGINNKEFILKCLPKKYKYDITSKVKMFRFLGINISIIFNTYEEYIVKDIVNTKDSLIIQGEQEVDLFLNQILTSGSNVKDKNVEIENTNDGIIYKVTVSVEENIGEFLETGDK